MGSGQSSTPKKVTFERKDGDAIEVTQEAFDAMTGKRKSTANATENEKENHPSKPEASNEHRSDGKSQLLYSDDRSHEELMEIERNFQERLRVLEGAQKRNLAQEKAALDAMVKELETKLSHSVVAIDGVCRAEQNAVISCYRDNPKRTMNCAKLVEQFSQCVHEERLRLLKSAGESQK